MAQRGKFKRTRRGVRHGSVHHRPLRFEPLEERRLLATYTVDTLQDVFDANDGVMSLREAVIAANATTAADAINFGPAITAGGPAVIVLTQGEILISRSLTITGPGPELLTIDASGSDPTPDVDNRDGSRIFRAQGSAINLSVSGLRLTGGDAPLGGAVSGNATANLQDLIVERNSGGGVFIQGNATISNCVFQDNVTIGNGGGLAVNGNLTIVDSVVTRNTAGDLSGGIDQWQGTVLVDNCEITFNSARNGGGIQTAGPTVEIRNSTISNNRAIGGDFGGGGLFNRDGWGNQLLRIVSSNIRDNVSESVGGFAQFTVGGGGILNHATGDVFVIDSIISGNTAVGITRASGGGIHNGHLSGQLYVDGSRIENNEASGKGGGIYGRGRADLSDTTVSGNQAGSQGGGVWNGGGATLLRSTIAGNHTTGTSAQGGGLFAGGISTITDSSISGNSTLGDQARGGGGYFTTNSTITLTRSTVSGNQTHGTNADGGGIYSRARVNLNDSTVSGNKTFGAQSDGGGVFSTELIAMRSTIAMNSVSGSGSAGGGVAANSVQSTNTIVALNSASAASPDIKTLSNVSAFSSLIGNTSGIPLVVGGGNLLNVAPLIGPLANNGGPTMTHALLVGSPAIDAGIPGWVAGMNGVPQFDQRGMPFGRVVDGDTVGGARIDMGAYERQQNEVYNLFVDTLDDESDGDYSMGDFSLREAIGLANGNPGADTISFAAALTVNGPATILLIHGELAISDSVTIDGPGANLLTIDASGNDPTPDVNNGDGSRVFNIDGGATTFHVELASLTVTGGDVTSSGGGIRTLRSLTIRDSMVRDNVVVRVGQLVPSGGGIYAVPVHGVFELERSIVADNDALGTSTEGGGLFLSPATGATSAIRGSVIRGNFAGRQGGGLSARGFLNVSDTTIDDNEAGFEGGGASLFASNGQTVTIASSTIMNNVAGRSGGGLRMISVFGDVLVSNVTVSGNQATQYGGGILSSIDGGNRIRLEHSTVYDNEAGLIATNGFGGAGGVAANSLEILHTIVAGNRSNLGTADDLGTSTFGPSTLLVGYSLIGDNAGSLLAEAPVGSPDASGNLVGGPDHGLIDPQLGPLVFNGGPTLTHAPLPGSPALDAGDPTAVAGMGGVPQFDQRGTPFSRVANGDDVPEARIDMGAVEWQPNPLTGDYNFNGVVDAADYVLWRKTVGSANDLRADGDLDADVDADDRGVWAVNFGSVLMPPIASNFVAASQPPALPGVSVVLRPEIGHGAVGAFAPAEPPAEPGAFGVFVDARVEGVNQRAVGARLVGRADSSIAVTHRDGGLLAWLRAFEDHGEVKDIDDVNFAVQGANNESAQPLDGAFEVALAGWDDAL